MPTIDIIIPCKYWRTTNKVIRNGHALKENNYTTEDKTDDFIQKGVNKKFQGVGYQFSSKKSLLPKELIELRELSTATSYWEYFEKWDSYNKQLPVVSIILAEENLIICIWFLYFVSSCSVVLAVTKRLFSHVFLWKLKYHKIWYLICNGSLILINFDTKWA